MSLDEEIRKSLGSGFATGVVGVLSQDQRYGELDPQQRENNEQIVLMLANGMYGITTNSYRDIVTQMLSQGQIPPENHRELLDSDMFLNTYLPMQDAYVDTIARFMETTQTTNLSLEDRAYLTQMTFESLDDYKAHLDMGLQGSYEFTMSQLALLNPTMSQDDFVQVNDAVRSYLGIYRTLMFQDAENLFSITYTPQASNDDDYAIAA